VDRGVDMDVTNSRELGYKGTAPAGPRWRALGCSVRRLDAIHDSMLKQMAARRGDTAPLAALLRRGSDRAG
jgi:hypothetical protein